MGVVNEAQAVKCSARVLRFGEFDEGGLDNNCQISHSIDWLDALLLHVTKVYRFVNPKLNDKWGFEYFRVRLMERQEDLSVEATGQAYNHEALKNFELPASIAPAARVFFDDFNDNSIDTDKWSTASATGFTESSQRLNVTNSASSHLVTVESFDMTSREVKVKFQSVPTASPNTEAKLIVSDFDLVEPYSIGVKGTTLRGVFAGAQVFSITYDPDVHVWGRMRFSRFVLHTGIVNKKVQYQTSANGENWSTLHTENEDFEVEDSFIFLRLQNTTGSPATASFDNIEIRDFD